MVSKYVDINKRRMLMKAFLIRSYLNARWCGCFTAETLKAESIKYMKDLCVQFKITDLIAKKDKSISTQQRMLQFVGI